MTVCVDSPKWHEHICNILCISTLSTVSINLLVSRDWSSATWNPKVRSTDLVSAWPLRKGRGTNPPRMPVLHPNVTSERWKTLGTQWWRELAHTPGNLGSASSWPCLHLTNDGAAPPACLASSYSSIQRDDNHPALWEGRRTWWKLRKNNELGKGEPSLQFTQPSSGPYLRSSARCSAMSDSLRLCRL